MNGYTKIPSLTKKYDYIQKLILIYDEIGLRYANHHDFEVAGKVIDVLREPTLSPKQVAGKLGVTYQTVLNWIERGSGGRKLEAVRLGTRYRTSPAALQRFVMTCDEIVTDNAEDERRELLERHGI